MINQLKLLASHRDIHLKEGKRCFIVGDIHGDWHSLQTVLSTVQFDLAQDVLVSVGDLIDRHEGSLKVANWMLTQENIHVVCGNHEKFFLDYIRQPETGFYYKSSSTGGWWVDLHNEADLLALAKLMKEKLSMAITIRQGDKKVGVTHAASPDDWYVVENGLLTSDDWLDYIDNRAQCRQAMQGFTTIKSGVDAVVHGHVGAPYFKGGNQHWIDTLYATGKLTLLSAADL